MANSLRDKFKKQKDDVYKRQETHSESHEGSSAYSVFIRDKIPEGVEFWKCKEGQHSIDIIPFLAGVNHPKETEGNIIWTFEFWAHRNVGPNGRTIICPSLMYGKRCPICEYIRKNRPPEEEYKELRAKRRNAFLIWDHTNSDEEDKGVQIWEIAHWFFKDKLDEIQVKSKGGGVIPFYDPDEGKMIAFTRRGSGQSNTQYLGHRFEDREEQSIPNDILDMADFSLDECMKCHTPYEEIYEEFFGEPCPDDKSLPSGGPVLKRSKEDDSPDPDRKEKSRDKERDESDDKPKDRGRREEEEEKPKEKEFKCSVEDGKFGVDFDNYRHCRRCDIYDECEQAFKEAEEKDKKRDKEKDDNRQERGEKNKSTREREERGGRIHRRDR